MRLIELLSITKAQNYILMQTDIDFQSKYKIYHQIIQSPSPQSSYTAQFSIFYRHQRTKPEKGLTLKVHFNKHQKPITSFLSHAYINNKKVRRLEREKGKYRPTCNKRVQWWKMQVLCLMKWYDAGILDGELLFWILVFSVKKRKPFFVSRW